MQIGGCLAGHTVDSGIDIDMGIDVDVDKDVGSYMAASTNWGSILVGVPVFAAYGRPVTLVSV